MQKLVLRLTVVAVLLAGVIAWPRPAVSAPPAAGWPTDQVILQYAPGAAGSGSAGAAAAQMDALSAAAGVTLTYFREMSGDAHVLKLPGRLDVAEVQAIADRLRTLPDVAYAEPDLVLRPMLVPNDPQYSNQWHYFAPVPGTYGANLPGAWDLTLGDASQRVAVLDTGILFTHPDLVGRTVAGYDFITNVSMANDGDGRDANPADPGDWEPEDACFAGSSPRDSSWHGTHVAGTIGAASNNAVGVAGINWISPIQPVRVLGRCGGAMSDIADAIRWSAGLSVGGVPNNATPARVINMSLGGPGACGATLQNAINAAVGAGAVVVVAAGNSNADASGHNPANCSNVITVAASNRDGNRAFYSNFGSVVEIAAPGGETNSMSTNGVLSTLNTGTTTPSTDTYGYYQGTSMAAPHVAGIASLVLSANPALTPAQVLSILQTTVTPFPGGSTCSTSTCGTGIVNAGTAVAKALADYSVYLPFVTRQAGAASSWTNIVTEGFEGSFPTGLWTVSEFGPGDYRWGKRDCQHSSGGSSAWAMGGGSNGSGLGCGSNYIDLANSWMVYGPFSLVGATDAELNYWLWLYSEYGWDFECVYASVNGGDFYGDCATGDSGGWLSQSFDLTNVYTLGDLRGQPSVWIAFRFVADESITFSEGAHVDDIVLRKCTFPSCPAVVNAMSGPGSGQFLEAPGSAALTEPTRDPNATPD